MKKLLMTMTALSAFAVAAPAAAQNGYGAQNGYANVNAGGAMGIQNRIANLDARFQAGLQSGAITRQEAQSIRPQLRQLRQLERQYSANGLTQWERQDLQQRVRTVREQLRMADGGRYAGRDSDDNYGQWNDDRYNNGQYNNGQYNNGYYGQGGPYQEVSEVCGSRSSSGGVLGGIIGSILGGGDNCLSVGERVTGNLGALPNQYRNQFRDGGGYYHRYVNGRVIQIDARTQTVVRIYDVD